MAENKISGENKFKLYTMVAAIVLIWSTAYNLMYYTVYSGGFPAEWIPAARTILPALAITIYVYSRGMRLPNLRDKRWLWYGLMGFFGMTAPFLLLALGNERGVESGMSSILTNGVTPLITIVLAHFLVKSERLSWRKSVGFAIGFVGVVFLFMPENLDLKLIQNWQAQAFILMVALSYALAAIVAKRAPDTTASVGAAIMLITAAITALVIALPSGIPNGSYSGGVLLALFVLTVFSTGLSDILYLKVIKMSGPSMIAKINYMVPVFAVIFGMIFLREAFSWRSIAAMMIIITGLLVAKADDKQRAEDKKLK
ncbi:MAG: EamA family transporter [Robiginitomaculum sp.]|nr:EamA family transporter [Robiginitomaculum sp.]